MTRKMKMKLRYYRAKEQAHNFLIN